jgi:hypothetical protein
MNKMNLELFFQSQNQKMSATTSSFSVREKQVGENANHNSFFFLFDFLCKYVFRCVEITVACRRIEFIEQQQRSEREQQFERNNKGNVENSHI